MLRQIKKSEVAKINRIMKKIGDKNNIGGFNVITKKNGRGDYGYDSEYYFEGRLFLVNSIDGSHQDIRFYRTEDTYAIIDQMKQRQ
jgi:hypothetical protein